MRENEAIRARVKAFIQDFADWNAKFHRPGFVTEPCDWDAAQKAFEAVATSHFVAAENVGSLGSAIGWPPEHSPEQEKIVFIAGQSDAQVIVETEVKEGLARYYEYTLRKVGVDWRIASVQALLSAKGERVKDINLKAFARRLGKPILTKEFPAGLDQLFRGPVQLRTSHGVVSTKVIPVGTIQAPSGFLTGDDPGNWQSGAAIFEMRIPPGAHEIELVIDDKLQIVGAARLSFGRQTKVSTVAFATRKDALSHDRSNTHVIGVDGGKIGLADAGAIVALSRRDRERLCSRLADSALNKHGRGAVFVPIGDSAQAWAIDSGCGDGAYAAYWQLDEQGQPVSLIFDFGDLALSIWETFRSPFEMKEFVGNVEGNELKSRGTAIRFGHERDQGMICVSSERQTKVKLFDSNHQLVFDSENNHGSWICGNETAYYLLGSFPKSLAGELELQVYAGHAYEII